VYLHAGQMARNLAVATRKIAALERDVKCLRADLAAAKATSGSKDTNMSDVAAMAMKKLERIEEQRRSRRRRRRERLRATPGAAEEPARDGTGAADFAAGENRDAPMEFADSEEPEPRMDVDPKSAVATGASSDVGALVPALPTAEVELLEGGFEDDDEEDEEDGDDEDDGDEEYEFKAGEVVVYCGKREAWEGEVLVEPGAVGTVLGPAEREKWDVLVEFPHLEINCFHYQLQLHTENEQKAITDGLPPKRLWSAIDHTGESPGPPESKKVQAKQDHGQADGGHEAKSQDYGTRFVNGNKGVG
jgi:hypothetical protein